MDRTWVVVGLLLLCVPGLQSTTVLHGVLSTSDLHHLLTPLPDHTFTSGSFQTSPSATTTIVVDANTTYQTLLGFGGAFTEAAAVNFASLSPSDQVDVLKGYFDPPEQGGHGYAIGRVHINSCDFSVKSYSFDDVSGDTNLEHFDTNVTHDTVAMIPMIKRALAMVPDLKIFASPWSPPAWMKGNGQMDGSSSPGLKTKDRPTWALYFSKFFTAYKAHGISLWGLTIQNEPEFAAPWEACVYNAQQETDFLRDNLGPVMRRDHPEVKIMIYDHNKNDVVGWAKTVYDDPVARKYADGTAVHWYVDGTDYSHLTATHDVAPDKFILATEACNCPGVKLKDWQRAENLAADMLGDLNNWAVGWTDWNLLVDYRGGPNHVNNFCDANIIADPQQHLGAGTVIKQVSYYLMGHFSRYLRPGFVRVGVTVSNGLDVTAARHPTSGGRAVVVMNRGGQPITFTLVDKDAGSVSGLVAPPHSVQTYYYTL